MDGTCKNFCALKQLIVSNSPEIYTTGLHEREVNLSSIYCREEWEIITTELCIIVWADRHLWRRGGRRFAAVTFYNDLTNMRCRTFSCNEQELQEVPR